MTMTDVSSGVWGIELASPAPICNCRAPSLRDQFAMAALTGMLAGPRTCAADDVQGWATDAYVFADAMMKAREGKK